ncbi:hypothetical protein Ddc_07430 [Ditylenchus destructor]|nr:hypothetical protein Ddc_07430 [Ditylenchus destructor]
MAPPATLTAAAIVVVQRAAEALAVPKITPNSFPRPPPSPHLLAWPRQINMAGEPSSLVLPPQCEHTALPVTDGRVRGGRAGDLRKAAVCPNILTGYLEV